MTAAILLAILVSGCSSSDNGADTHGGSVPDVVGELARPAVTDLRAAGFERFAVKGVWSANPVGTVLSQTPSADTFSDSGTSAELVLSLGAETSERVFVGLGTCDLGPQAARLCVGGPVALRPQR